MKNVFLFDDLSVASRISRLTGLNFDALDLPYIVAPDKIAEKISISTFPVFQMKSLFYVLFLSLRYLNICMRVEICWRVGMKINIIFFHNPH